MSRKPRILRKQINRNSAHCNVLEAGHHPNHPNVHLRARATLVPVPASSEVIGPEVKLHTWGSVCPSHMHLVADTEHSHSTAIHPATGWAREGAPIVTPLSQNS